MAPDRAARLAAFYDLDLRDDPGDLDLYLALADREGGPVLELGVGTGRLAVPLAAAGHAVTGVDDDAAMLARAAARWERPGRRRHGRSRGGLELVQADLLEVDLGARFGLAFLALNSLFLMGTYERQVAAVRALARHLRPGGLALVDVWLPSADELSAYDARLALEWLRPDEDGRHQVAKLGSARLDTSAATVSLTTFFDRWASDGGPVERTARTDELRLVTAAELTAMAQAAGLGVEMLAGDYRMEPFLVLERSGCCSSDAWYSRPVASALPDQIRLLLVEDVPQVAQYVRNLLNSQQRIKLFDIQKDGRAVAEQIHQLRPDVVMIDSLLQGRMKGLQVAEQIRREGAGPPIIILTVPQNPVQVDPAKGVDRVLSMPFTGFDLVRS